MRLGIDLGGTKIAAIVLDDAGRLVWEARVSTPRDDYDATIQAIGGLIDQGEHAAGERCSVGIGMPGAISPATGLVKNSNSTWLNGKRFHEDLESRLRRDVRLANDANCLVQSETSPGGAASAALMTFGVILGTGTGGAVSWSGWGNITGANAIAGEWGHNPLPWPDDDERPGPACYCGRHGCIETFLSGPALAADHRRRTGTTLTGEQIVAAADAGEGAAKGTMDRWIGRLAKSLATVINLLDPDVIVVGGGLSRIERLYRDVPQQWGPWVFSDTVVTRITPATFGDASGARGAAWLW
jgi:fructokinase